MVIVAEPCEYIEIIELYTLSREIMWIISQESYYKKIKEEGWMSGSSIVIERW